MNNIITIDQSLTSTAVSINGSLFVYAKDDVAMTKTGKWKKWFSLCEPYVDIKVHSIPASTLGYSEREVDMLFACYEIAEKIQKDITENIVHGEPVHIAIEGYSYSSDAGPLIDLVTLGTLIRERVARVPNLQSLRVIAPMTLKLESAKLTYEPTITGKRVLKYTYRNHEGVAGGSFKKGEMLLAITQNDSHGDPWANFLRENQDEILDMKSVPKPIEDINDAYLMSEYVKSLNNSG